MAIIKQSVGIDIAKDTFTACVAKMNEDRKIQSSGVVTFKNNKTGFNQLVRWVKKECEKAVAISYFMEATGTYYEPLANQLHKLKKNVGVILANKVSHFAKSLNVKNKTDKVDAMIIARMGVERDLDLWTPASKHYKQLRSLARLYGNLQKDKTVTSNRLGALNAGFEPCKTSVKHYKSLIKNLDKKLNDIEAEMKEHLKKDAESWAKIQNLLTIPGVAIKTAAIVVGETEGFRLFKNQRQLVSFAGMDVVGMQSGTSIKGKKNISKKGNSHIRAALYFPAMSAARHNKKMKAIYNRINADKPNKMTGLVAVERRLLVLMFSIWRSGIPFSQDYIQNAKSDNQVEESSSSSSTQKVEKVDGAQELSSTQNEHLHEQASDVLLRLRKDE